MVEGIPVVPSLWRFRNRFRNTKVVRDRLTVDASVKGPMVREVQLRQRHLHDQAPQLSLARAWRGGYVHVCQNAHLRQIIFPPHA